MSVPIIRRPAKVGKVDRFFIRLDPEWLGSDSISAATVVTSDSFITIGAIDFGVILPNEIGFFVTGVSAGASIIDIDITTSSGRTDCKHVQINSEEC